MEQAYDKRFEPPAPVLQVVLVGSTAERVERIQVDTGSDITLVPAKISQGLGARWVTAVPITAVGVPPALRDCYCLTVRIPGIAEYSVVAAAVDDYLLLGRDILNQLKLLLDGPGQILEIL